MIRYQLERFDNYYADTQELWNKHFDEISINKDKRKLDPDVENYRKLEKGNRLAIYTARDDDKLIGYAVAVIARPLHYNHKAAMFDMYYVLPEYRKGHIGINLLKGFEEELKKRGVVEMHGGTKAHKDISKVFEHLGWNKTEIRFVKWIGE